MALRNEHGKLRPAAPRLKDLSRARTAPERERGRDQRGRFAPGNGAARRRGVKAAIRRSLGRDASDEAVRAVLVLYNALRRDLADEGPAVLATVAAQARNVWMASEYGEAARAAGLATEEGMKLADRSRAHDVAAQRLAVTALDLATRAAASRADDEHDAEDPFRVPAARLRVEAPAPEPERANDAGRDEARDEQPARAAAAPSPDRSRERDTGSGQAVAPTTDDTRAQVARDEKAPAAP